jgi:hypothetical protein
MAKEQTEKSRYPSRYSPGEFISEAQYIIELACEQAARKRKIDLPIKFWNLPQWAQTYKAQLRAVHTLLKKYPGKIIIKVVKEKKYDNLRPKWVEEAIKQEYLFAEAVKPIEEKNVSHIRLDAKDIKLPEKQTTKTNLSKLMDLDNI